MPAPAPGAATSPGAPLPVQRSLGLIDRSTNKQRGPFEAGARVGPHETRGVMRRDVEPANVLLEQEGVPCLADSGLCKVEGDQSLTREQELPPSAGWEGDLVRDAATCPVRSRSPSPETGRRRRTRGGRGDHGRTVGPLEGPLLEADAGVRSEPYLAPGGSPSSPSDADGLEPVISSQALGISRRLRSPPSKEAALEELDALARQR